MITFMTSTEIRERFLNFFQNRGHKILPSVSLVPENDPSVLFITAGMQPLIPFLMGQPHPQGKRLANIQKCIRTVDFENIGDNTHNTFFEMLGNWSLGDYFKEEAIKWSFELLTSKEEGFELDPTRLYITVFAGDENVDADKESKKLWMEAGIPENRIYFLGADANWWPNVKGNDAWSGPTGPSSEMFYDLTSEGLGDLTHEEFLKADDEQNIVEIWNDVFMTYEKKQGNISGELKVKNVDTGAGLERLAAVLQGKKSMFETDLFLPIMDVIPSGDERARRIVADHIRASVFLIADGVIPANTDRGYILRRLLRRALRYAKNVGANLEDVAEAVILKYGTIYENVSTQSDYIKTQIKEEQESFKKTLDKGLKEFENLSSGDISGKDAFLLFSSYGFPLELSVELAKERGIEVDENGFREELKRHQKLSRSGAEKKFKGGLADTSEMSLKYHTATHLLHQALTDVLGPHIEQKGSNITPERLRFDFAHPQKMTEEEKKKVEDIVNQKIAEAIPVQSVTLDLKEAEKTGARHFFGEKYGDRVSVYFIGQDLDSAYSKEFCGGPHVKNTSEISGKFKIVKEEAVASGIRRIKATLQ